MSAREWEAATYPRVAGPREAWGRAVLERPVLRGDENPASSTVADHGPGCRWYGRVRGP